MKLKKKASTTLLTSENMDFTTKTVTQDKEEHYIML